MCLDLCLGKGPLWFDSCKQPPPVSDHSAFAFWVIACLLEIRLYRVITCSALGLYIQQGVDVLTIVFIAQLYCLRNSLLP